MARRYSSTGTLTNTTFVAASYTNNETLSAVAHGMGFNYNFSIAYVVDGVNVSLKRYNSSVSVLGTHAVAATANSETNPSVAMDNYGNTVVAYEKYVSPDWDIYVLKVSSTGVLSATWAIQTGSYDDKDPSVAMDYTDGDFVVAYHQYRSASAAYIYAAEVSTSGTLRATYYVSTTTANGPSVCINSLDDYFIAYERFISDALGKEIYGRRGRL